MCRSTNAPGSKSFRSAPILEKNRTDCEIADETQERRGPEGDVDGSVIELLTEDIATAIPTTTVGRECFFCEAPATYENPVFFWCGSENCKDLIQTASDIRPASICKSEFVRKILLRSALLRIEQSAVQSVVQHALDSNYH